MTDLLAARVSGADFMAWCDRHPEYLARPLREALVAAALELKTNDEAASNWLAIALRHWLGTPEP